MSANPDGPEGRNGHANARSNARANPGLAWPAWVVGVLAAVVLLPACLAAAHASRVGDAAHDEAVLRALGLGWTGAFRALDAPWGGLFGWLPVGTRALRASLASAAAGGVGAGLVFLVARALLERVSPAPRLGPSVAGIAALAAALSPPWQLEGASPAGSTLGAALALLPSAILLGSQRDLRVRVPVAALGAGVALAYEPLVGLAATASLVAYLVALPRAERAGLPLVRATIALLVGLAPFALAFSRRASPLAMAVGPFAAPAGERGESVAGMISALARDDIGSVSSALVVVGAVIALLAAGARPGAAALLAVVGAGVLSLAVGAPAGPTRYGAPVLAGIGAAYALAGAAMLALVQAVSRAKIPFAGASATMILLLEAALPARAADDSSTRADERPGGSSEAWDEAAWGALPAGAALLVRDPRVEARLYATRATGELRADLALVPLFDLGGRGALRELARDPKLSPVWRDAALIGAQEEWSLSSLAQERPVVAAYDPAWDRALARHLVPVGLFARFEPEPRGASDRRRALDLLSPSPAPPAGAAPAVTAPAAAVLTTPPSPSERDRLAHAIEGDPELLGLTARLLRARALALAAASERDVVLHALDDLRPFSPRDPLAAELVRRMAASHGSIDVRDLAP